MYQAKSRGDKRNYKTEIENLQIMLAHECSHLSEGQAAKAIGTDRIGLRKMMADARTLGTNLAGQILGKDGASGSVEQSDGESVAAESSPHKWDGDGERCEVCGDKSWFAGPVCNPPIDLFGLVEHLAREAYFDRFRLENNLHQMSELWVKDRWVHVANLERWAKGVSQLTTMPAERSKK